jgi:hypothetical protein
MLIGFWGCLLRLQLESRGDGTARHASKLKGTRGRLLRQEEEEDEPRRTTPTDCTAEGKICYESDWEQLIQAAEESSS